jgi:SAM-dependent methyltransferase
LARAKTKPWHEDDRFWEIAAPVLYPAARQAMVPSEVDALLALGKIAPGSRILDQGCGPGRYTLELARRGFKTVGVDRTAAYLARAAGLSRTEKLETRFEHGDIRQFVRPDAFDAVINLHDGVGPFDDALDDLAVVRNAWTSLRVGGTFVLSLRPRQNVPAGVRQEDYREEDGLDLLEERILPAGSDRQAIHWVLYQGDERFEFQWQIRLYEAAELTQLFETAGFRQVTLYADLVGAPYHAGATRLVAVARKETRE